MIGASARTGRARGVWSGLLSVATATIGVAATQVGAPMAAAAASPVGSAVVSAIAVSPAFAGTGLAAVVATPQQDCSSGQCAQLWVTHDGGATWVRPIAAGWQGGPPVISVDASGRETLWAGGNGSVQRSDDAGATWTQAGADGVPSPSPSYPSDATVAVAAHAGDYVLRSGSPSPVAGSQGAYLDQQFALSPAFAGGGGRAAALLGVSDPGSGLPAVERCDHSLRCSSPAPLAGADASGTPAIALSTGFAGDGVAFVRTPRAVYRSSDGGASFSPLRVPGAGAATTMSGLALGAGYSEAGGTRTLFVSVVTVDLAKGRSSGGIERSDDGGATWEQAGPGSALDGGATAIAAAPGGRLFAGYIADTSGSAGLLCSADGSTWAGTCPPLNVGSSRATGAGPPVASGGVGACSGRCTATASSTSASGGSGASASAQAAVEGGSLVAPSGSGGTAAILPGAQAGGPSSGGHAGALVAAVAVVAAVAAAAAVAWRRLLHHAGPEG